VLLDHNLPQPLRRHLPGHDVRTAGYQGWDALRNGVLLRAVADDGFDLLLTVDKAMEYEQNLTTLPIPIVHMDAPSTRLPDLLPFLPATLALLATPLTPALYVVAADGTVTRLIPPRRMMGQRPNRSRLMLLDTDIAPPAELKVKTVAAEHLVGDKIQPGHPLFGLVWINPARMHGTPCFYGSRVSLQALFDSLAAGETLDEFLYDFKGVTAEQALRVLGMAAQGLLSQLDRL
jgi:uncharacterized protein (DUF433 family)